MREKNTTPDRLTVKQMALSRDKRSRRESPRTRLKKSMKRLRERQRAAERKFVVSQDYVVPFCGGLGAGFD